jgi:hypothetical protein
MARYSLLRILIFFGLLCVLWLCGLRGWPLLLLTAVASAIISLLALRGPREQFAGQLEQKISKRMEKADEMRTSEDDD